MEPTFHNPYQILVCNTIVTHLCAAVNSCKNGRSVPWRTRRDRLLTPRAGLYDPMYEHDACGLGFVARLDGRGTRETVEEGLEVLRNLEHRGTTGSDPETGDGAGILIQIPDAFFRRECKDLGIELPKVGCYGVGMLFESGDAEGPDCDGRLAGISAAGG